MSGAHFVGKETVKAEPIEFHNTILVIFLLSIKFSDGKTTVDLDYYVTKEMEYFVSS
jgi:hypothetical protein